MAWEPTNDPTNEWKPFDKPNVTPSTTTLETPDLLDANEFRKYKNLDTEWFLSSIGNMIRQYCNWHISPVKSQVSECLVGPNGVIVLPSLKVLSVEHVWRKELDGDTRELMRNDYTVHEAGWIQWDPLRAIGPRSPVMGAQRENYHWQQRIGRLNVSFTHGYRETPPIVQQVAYEIAVRALEKPAGVVKSMNIGPYEYDFMKFGAYVDEDQRMRLAPYALQGIA